MHKAAEGGQLGMLKFLTPLFGARVHDKDSNGCTILHCAAQSSDCRVARYIINELKMNPQDKDQVRVKGRGGKGGVSKVQNLCT